MDKNVLAGMIDHTLLKADATTADIKALCEEAKKYGTASVCVNSINVYTAHKALMGSSIKVCAVVGFPLGAMASAAKAFEAACAIEDGADEIDMVMNIGAAKAGNWQKVEDDIATVLDACEDSDALLKVIIETCLLTDDEKVKACIAAKNAGAHFVKTSTGFSSDGATVADVSLMRKTVGDSMGVKASGKVRNYETAVAMIEAGANRLGTSSTALILE